MSQDRAAPLAVYAGLFLTALSTLMFEILLTRIFSATTWYHFAFMAVSVAMFGMTVGALVVYLRPQLYTVERAPAQLATSTLAFALAIPLSFLALLCIPFEESITVVGIFSFALTYAVIAVPFLFSGIAVCIALTKFPRQVSSLYAADLAGAGIGCIALFQTLESTDGRTAVLVVAALAALGAAVFAIGARRPVLAVVTALICAGLGWLSYDHHQRTLRGEPPIQFVWAKGGKTAPVDFERWNSFSRITVQKVAGLEPSPPLGWGMSPALPDDYRIRQYGLLIDGVAGTPITEFDGEDTAPLEFLKWDVTNVAHYLRDDAVVLVVGVGGGRDLLSALVFDQKEVIGVELNDNIRSVLVDEFGDFAGHLDQHPKVRLVSDEARSYIARHDERYDLLQISLIDTWAATAAGAFVLAENALYTMEGWGIFLDHLEPQGLLTVSRWYGNWPGELYRMAALAVAALRARGVAEPHRHLAVVKSATVGNLIVGRDPLSDEDLATLAREAERMQFTLQLQRGESPDPILQQIAVGEEVTDFGTGLRLDLSPPTDDRPFFFNMLRLDDAIEMLRPEAILERARQPKRALEANLKAVLMLAVLLGVVVVLTLLCVGLPLLLTIRQVPWLRAGPLFLFFAAIGFGFMLVELSQMHRLILFLGHPTYGLTVVLFALLLSSGIGSLLSRRFDDVARAGPRVLLALLVLLAAFGFGTPVLATHLESAINPVRIGVAIALLFPLGLLMGMAFPLGLRLASRRAESLTPWLWGVNGATSVCATVLSTAIAMMASISAAFWAGVACYVVALLAFIWARAMAPR